MSKIILIINIMIIQHILINSYLKEKKGEIKLKENKVERDFPVIS